MNQPLGRHLLVEFHDCNTAVINDLERIRQALLQAATLAEATIVTDVFHQFNPHGISGVVVIAESHIAIHTWPEHRCASIDIFSCSPKMKTERITPFLQTVFEAESTMCREFERGGKQPKFQSGPDLNPREARI
jgi:S-adenosylmethionine decarboxylase proenzyme